MMKSKLFSYFLLTLFISALTLISNYAIAAVTFQVVTDNSLVGRTSGATEFFFEGGAQDADLSSLPCCDGVNDGTLPEGSDEQVGLNTAGTTSIFTNQLASDSSIFSSTFLTFTATYANPIIIGDNAVSNFSQQVEVLYVPGGPQPGATLVNAGQNITRFNANNTFENIDFQTEDANFTTVSNTINGYYITQGQVPSVVFADPNLFAGANQLIDQQSVIDHFEFLISIVPANWTVLAFDFIAFTANAKPGGAFPDLFGVGIQSTVSFDQEAIPVMIEPLAVAAATLPTSRSVQTTQTATAFASVINPNSNNATDCSIAAVTSIPATFSYQATDMSNNPMGSADTPVDIAAGATQNFIISLTPSAVIAPTEVEFDFTCANTNSATSTVGLNTLLFSADTVAQPDVIGLTTEVDLQGIINSTTLFAVGSANVGVTGDITVSVDGGALPLNLSICQTDVMGACVGTPASTVTINYTAGSTESFAVFVTPTAAISNDPANNRIFMRFRDTGGVDRGATSTAVRTQ